MRAHRQRLGIGLVAFVLLASGACGDDDDSSSTSDTTAASESTDTTSASADVNEASVTTVDFAFQDLPDLTAGVNELTIDNTGGTVEHEFAVVQLDDASSIPDFAAAMPAVLEGGPFPDAVGTGAGSAAVAPGETLTFQFTLPEAGRYVAFCLLTGDPDLPEGEDGQPHLARGMVAEVEVSDGDSAAAIEGTDGTITAVDYDFEPDVEAGDTSITFTNDGPEQYHFASISEFPEGTTAADAEATLQTLLALPEDQPPPEGTVFPEDVVESGVAGPGVSSTLEVPGGFESGRTYIVVCFISDRTGGPPHAIGNQMFHAFTVE